MFVNLQHGAIARTRPSANRAGASGEGRGFEARKLSRLPCAACSRPCNTRHRTHAGRQPLEPAPAGRGAGSRPVNSPGVHVLHIREPATRGIAGTRASAKGAGASGERRGFVCRRLTGRSCAACSRLCNTRQRTHARCQPMEPAPVRGRALVRGRKLTRRSCAACSRPCSTRHRTHAGR